MEIGRIEKLIHSKIKKERALHFTLVDPAEQSAEDTISMVKKAEKAGTDAIMVGGTVGAGLILNETVKAIKNASKLPVILFPGNIDGVSPYADALFFMSLMNSRNPYWITGAQALSAPIVARFQREGLDAIPMAYLIVEPGNRTAAGWVGDANPLPQIKPKLTAAYALAAQLMGQRLAYLEAGSGAPESVPNAIIKEVKRAAKIPIIVGGGIRSPSLAENKVKAGADIIVTGTIVENNIEKLRSIISAIKKAGRSKK